MRILFILLILLSVACKSKKEATSNQDSIKVEEAEAKTTMEEEVIQKETPKNINFPKNAIARIQRTACFGRCPIYTLTVYDDGSAELFAERWLEQEGKFTATVDQSKFQNLLEKAEAINFFELEDVYNSEAVTDLPSTITTLRRDDELKQIVNRYQGPQELSDFEKFFDELYLKSDWKKKE